MSRTLPELLRGYNQSHIARELTARGVKVARATVNGWAQGSSNPEVRVLPALAEIIRVDLAELTNIVAAQAAA